VCTSCV